MVLYIIPHHKVAVLYHYHIPIMRGRYRSVLSFISDRSTPANIYLFKVNNRNTRKRSKICSKLTIKTSEQRQ